MSKQRHVLKAETRMGARTNAEPARWVLTQRSKHWLLSRVSCTARVARNMSSAGRERERKLQRWRSTSCFASIYSYVMVYRTGHVIARTNEAVSLTHKKPEST